MVIQRNKRSNLEMPKTKSAPIVDHLLEIRPTLAPLRAAKNLGEYLAPVLAWPSQPALFPKSPVFLDLITQEIRTSYGREVAEQAHHQLQQNFALETGLHTSLPRLYDRAAIQSIALSNINTLIFQANLYSAAAHWKAGHRIHISCSTGRISLSNINSGAYFQPDKTQLVRLQSNKLDRTPQFLLPPLTIDGLSKLLKQSALTEAGTRRRALLAQSIERHPNSFSRQIATAHSALYNDILPNGIRQVSVDYELFIPQFLIALLQDQNSLTHQLFATPQGLDFIMNSFEGVNTGWKQGSAPFDALEITNGLPRMAYEAYRGDLSPTALCTALAEKKIIPKTALVFLVFMLEAGIAPTGGMMQTLYATQIRDKIVAWLKTNYPRDPRLEALAHIPTDRAISTPIWAVKADDMATPLGYQDALASWRLDETMANNLLNVSGETALEAGAILINNFIFPDHKLPDEERQDMLCELARNSDILKIS